MATVTYELTTNIWRRISAAGEGGTCWIVEMQDNQAIKINHTASPGAGPPNTIEVGSAAEITAGLDDHENAYPLTFKDGAVTIPADSASDVYYALYVDNRTATVDTAKITADMV